jgi:hypothetical protein
MGGNARWMAAAIRMDGGGKITMDGGSGDGQRWCNGQQNGKTIALGKEVQWEGRKMDGNGNYNG